jgi:hypothetical protein
LIKYILREIRPPKNAVEEGRDVRQILCIKNAFILAWILVVVIFIEFASWIQRLYTVLGVDCN